jgi:hypothetical protein
MGKKDTKLLLPCLKPFPAHVREKAMWIRELIWDAYPDSNELIYDNYNAVAVGWSPTVRVGHTFCSFALGRSSHNVHFGFYYGAELSDPKNLLLGEGNQYRYLLVKDRADFPEPYVRKLMKAAYENSLARVKDPKLLIAGQTIFKSESAKKRKSKKKRPGKS